MVFQRHIFSNLSILPFFFSFSQEGINETRSFLEDAKKLPPGGNGRNVLVATHELESFAIKYGKTHLTANESAVIVQELLVSFVLCLISQGFFVVLFFFCCCFFFFQQGSGAYGRKLIKAY